MMMGIKRTYGTNVENCGAYGRRIMAISVIATAEKKVSMMEICLARYLRLLFFIRE